MGKVLNIKCKYCGKYGIKATELKLTDTECLIYLFKKFN